MRSLRTLAIAGCVALTAGVPQSQAGGFASSGGSTGYANFGSSGGYGSSGGLASYSSSGGSTGYGSSGGSSGGYVANQGSSGGASARQVGPVRGLLARIRAHKASRYASSGASSGGSSGGYYTGFRGASSGGYTGGSSGGYYVRSSGSSGGYNASSGGHVTSLGGQSASSGGQVSYGGFASSGVASASVPLSSPGGYSNPVPTSYVSDQSHSDSFGLDSSFTDMPDDFVTANAAAADSYSAARADLDTDSAMLEVAVPASATVTVNDRETTSDGSLRKFLSKGLRDGFVYTYVVKATFKVDGEDVTQTKEVKLRPGDVELISFNEKVSGAADDDQTDADMKSSEEEVADDAMSSNSSDELMTIVRLRVPVDSKVSLAGNLTKGNGTVRTFRTKQLAKGDSWKDYTVSVTSMVDGQPITKQRTITVYAGDTKDLEFTFDSAALAVK